MSDFINSLVPRQHGSSYNTVSPIAAHTPPEPIVIVNEKYYMSTMGNINMISYDGTKIVFLHHTFHTTVMSLQNYLDAEIAGGNYFIRHATDEDISNIRMKTEPKTVMLEQVRGEMEDKLRTELETEIMSKYNIVSGAPLGGISNTTTLSELISNSGGQSGSASAASSSGKA